MPRHDCLTSEGHICVPEEPSGGQVFGDALPMRFAGNAKMSYPRKAFREIASLILTSEKELF